MLEGADMLLAGSKNNKSGSRMQTLFCVVYSHLQSQIGLLFLPIPNCTAWQQGGNSLTYSKYHEISNNSHYLIKITIDVFCFIINNSSVTMDNDKSEKRIRV